MMILSIILPVKDRPEATKSLLNELCRQKETYPQTEIIVVENGSTEDMSFLDQYDAIVIHEKQRGVNHARNVALDLCKGDYICFVDNDDMVMPNYLDTIYKNIETKYDWYAWQWFSDDRPVLMEDFDVKNPMKSNWALWGYAFSRKIFDDFRFDNDGYAQGDMKIIPQMQKEWRGCFIKELLYRFTWDGNEDSLSHRHNRGEDTRQG